MQIWYTYSSPKTDPVCQTIVLGFIVSGLYVVFILNLLLKEYYAHRPEKKDAGYFDLSSFENFVKAFEIFLPVTQVDFLGTSARFHSGLNGLLGRIGRIVIAILSGFGAVNCPVQFFNFYNKNSNSSCFPL